MMFNKEELTKVTGAELLKDSGKSLNYNIYTDTRTIKSNDIFCVSSNNIDMLLASIALIAATAFLSMQGICT